MSYEYPGAGAPMDESCRYGGSRILCRGPLRPLTAPYYAFLGDNETFGRFVKRPFAALIERSSGQVCVNLGSANAGMDTYLGEGGLMDIAAAAETAVIQVMGAQNLDNPFYRVHPRRNDRFLAPTAQLTGLFPEIDFTDFNFNKHLVIALRQRSRKRFRLVADSLRQTWIARMDAMLSVMARPPVLLWLRYGEARSAEAKDGVAANPMLVDRRMVDRFENRVRAVVELRVRAAGLADDMAGMVHPPMQAAAAAHLIGQRTHYTIAEAVMAALPTDMDDVQKKRPA